MTRAACRTCFAGCDPSSPVRKELTAVHTETIVLDPDRKDVTLTALCWDPSPALQDASRPRPGLLILPGGGYQSHAHREMDPIALRFAAMGYHTFILRYSLMRPDGACLHPQPLIDVARAMCLLRERAQAWCMDPERIGVCGFSAGGHLALMYAVSHAQPWLQEAAGLHCPPPRPAVCIAGYPVVDGMGWTDDQCPHPMTRAVRDECRLGLFGRSQPSPALLAAANPAAHVTPDAPPAFLWATAEDVKAPAANVLHMAEALLAAGVPVETHIFEGGEHGLALACPASAGVHRKVEPDAARWVSLCEAWLNRRFALTLTD